MGYKWSDAAEGEAIGDKLLLGICKVKGTKIITGNANGAFASKKGDPQIGLVVEDADGREGFVMFTLSDKAAWTLSRWLSRCGVDLKAMEAEGIDPDHFANEDIAAQYLVGKEVWVKVELDKDPKYQRLTPLHEDEMAKERAALGKGPQTSGSAPTAPSPARREGLPTGPNCKHTIEDSQCDLAECCGSPF